MPGGLGLGYDGIGVNDIVIGHQKLRLVRGGGDLPWSGSGRPRNRRSFARHRSRLHCNVLGDGRFALHAIRALGPGGGRNLQVCPVGGVLQIRQEIAVPGEAIAHRNGLLEHARTAARTEPVVEADAHDIVSIVAGRRGEAHAQALGIGAILVAPLALM